MEASEPVGNVHAVVGIGSSLTVSAYDEGDNVTPSEFIRRYRAYFELPESRVTRFQEPLPNGCMIFVANLDDSSELLTTAIFVPQGVDKREAMRTLATLFQTAVSDFDASLEAAVKMTAE
jgi:hypothetical protein